MKSTKSSSILSIPWLIIFTMLKYSVLAQNNIIIDPQSTISEKNCPPPLRARGPNAHKSDSQNCVNGCCLACPFSNNFYEENLIETTYRIFAILGIISFFLMFILCAFFIVLPSQKQNPLTKLVLLPLALSVMCFEGAEFFTLNQKQSQCADSITPADSTTNAYCAVQAFFTLSGACAIACYSSLLMTHLHLVSVWRVEFITKNIIFFHALIFGGSLAAYIVPYITHNISSTNICFISLDAAPAYFYFLFFIYIAFAAHLTTFIYMAHISIKSNKRYSAMSTASRRNTLLETQRKLNHLNTVFKVQWRALLGALLMLIIYVLNWHFYIFGLRLLTKSVLSTEWVIIWIKCLQTYGDQSICANEIKEYIPRYGYIVTLLFFNRTAGILIFIIFAAKKSILLEAYDIFIRGVRPRDHLNVSYNSYNETESRFSVNHSRATSIERRNSRLNNYKNDDNISNVTEIATLASSERTSISKAGNSMGQNPNQEDRRISISFSHNLPSRRDSLVISTSPTSISEPRQSILLFTKENEKL